MAELAIEQAVKRYPNGFEAIKGIDLEAQDGEFLILVGPSGCGKSTLLRMIAGLEDISGGTMRIGDRVVNDLSPKQRDVAMVFQNYALYPHMTVGENMGFALKLARTDKSEIETRVKEAADLLGLTELLDRKPAQLSGGQRQRVAMGRAIVRQPNIFLMDEPLSNLDAKLRVQMRSEIAQLQRRLGVTTIYVTHDQVEAMTMGDKVAVLNAGKLMQCAAPQELYDRPANLFVATFIGSPSMNMAEATVIDQGGLMVDLGQDQLSIPPEALASYPRVKDKVGQKVAVGMRPEHIAIGTPGERDTLKADVQLVEALGNEIVTHFTVGARPVLTEAAKQAVDSEDLVAELERAAAEGRVEFAARMSPDLRPTEGETTAFAVDTTRLHFFDLEQGAALR